MEWLMKYDSQIALIGLGVVVLLCCGAVGCDALFRRRREEHMSKLSKSISAINTKDNFYVPINYTGNLKN